MTCAPWFDVGRRTAACDGRRLGNNLALAVWGSAPLRNPAISALRPTLCLTRGAGHAVRAAVPFWGGLVTYALAYRPDRIGD